MLVVYFILYAISVNSFDLTIGRTRKQINLCN